MIGKMSHNQFIINNLKLPETLIELIQTDQWKPPKDKSGIKKILELPEDLKTKFDPFDDYIYFGTYTLDLMKKESLGIQKWTKRQGFGCMFLGALDEMVKPGNIDFNKSILIADLGIGSDSPFVLDYRDDIKNPSVIMIRWGKDPIKDNRWMKVTDNFDEFVEIIGIKAPNNA